MAEEKIDREFSFRQLLPWTAIFRCFQIALDWQKLLVAAGGIISMAVAWWLLAVVFFNAVSPPKEADYTSLEYKNYYVNKAPEGVNSQDYAELMARNDFAAEKAKYDLLERMAGPGGKLRTMPWFEDRGPNPYLLITGQTPLSEWSLGRQILVLIEPLDKFFRPIINLVTPGAGFVNRLYNLLVIVVSLAVWAFFGGIITRLAVTQFADKDQSSLFEAFQFVCKRYPQYLAAPLVPLVIIGVIVVLMGILGLVHLIPGVGDLFDGLFWWVSLAFGLVMAFMLVGLVGYPLMYPTISTEGGDFTDAITRCYSYVCQAPWHYLWNCLVAVLYGAVLIFFVGLMGSLTIYLSKWGVSQAPLTETVGRQPEYLFVYAPTSFGWRELLLKGSPAVDPATQHVSEDLRRQYITETFYWWNRVAAFMVAVWLTLALLIVLGFGYSYFWTASTMIYLLMRQQVDDTELDEVYLEDEDADDLVPPTPPSYPPSGNAAPATQPAAPATSLTMLDPPGVRSPAPAPSPPPVPAAPTSASHVVAAPTTSEPTPPAASEETSKAPSAPIDSDPKPTP